MVTAAGPDARPSVLCTGLELLALEAASSALRRVDRCWKNLGDEEDIEAVHRLRTGTNRMRSLLKLVGPVCNWPQIKETEASLERWQKSWGPVRDLDVLILHLAEWSKGMQPAARRTADHVLAVYRRRRAALYAKAMKEIGKKRGKQARETLDRLKRWIRQRRRALKKMKSAPGKKKPATIRPSITLLWPQVTRVWRSRKAKAEKDFHGLVLHKFRLANKRLRHVLQLYKPVAEPAWIDLLQVVDDLHENLGVLHDIEVLIGQTETLAARWVRNASPRKGLSPREVQLLLGILDTRRREAFGRVLELWRRINLQETKSLLADPVRPTKPRTPPARKRVRMRTSMRRSTQRQVGRRGRALLTDGH